MKYILNAITGRLDLISNLVTDIAGLNTMLQNKGLQIIASTGYNASDNTGPNLQLQTTTRINVIPSVSASHIVLAFANYTGQSGGIGEQAGNSYPNIICCLENSALGSETTQSSQRYIVKFSGQRWKTLDPYGIVYSDPIPFQVTKGVPFFIWVGMQVGGFAQPYCIGYSAKGGTAPGSITATGEGVILGGNICYPGSTAMTLGISQFGYAPSAVLGYSSSYCKSVGIMGDSIADNTTDGGMGALSGGYAERICAGQLSLVRQYPVTPPVAYVKVPKCGETLAQYLANNMRRSELLTLCSNIFCEYGTNDIVNGATLATMKANMLLNANYWTALGKKFVQTTILPRVTSTDGFVTTANQTPLATESVRQGVNSWLRDSSINGFISQSANPTLTAVFDAAAPVEVNSSNVLTLNGSYWKIRGAAAHTGTLTTVTSLTSFTDSALGAVQDYYRGYCLCMTSGAAANTQADIFSNSSGGLMALGSVSTGLSILPSAGDSYSLFNNQYTVDGTHPTSYGHTVISNTGNINIFI